MLKALDPTFTINSERDFQARNAKAYEVELLVAPSRVATLGSKDQHAVGMSSCSGAGNRRRSISTEPSCRPPGLVIRKREIDRRSRVIELRPDRRRFKSQE